MDTLYQAIVVGNTGQEIRSGLFTSEAEAATFLDQITTSCSGLRTPRVEPVAAGWAKGGALGTQQRQATGAGGTGRKT